VSEILSLVCIGCQVYKLIFMFFLFAFQASYFIAGNCCVLLPKFVYFMGANDFFLLFIMPNLFLYDSQTEIL
jgi:hypothetical protein